jgi:anthranilate phosphoribosyltransferase
VVAGDDGMDEISTTGPTRISETAGTTVTTREIAPEDFGLPRAPAEALRGGEPETNARLLRQVLEGEKGPLRDVVLANASAALVAAGKATDFPQGAAQAAEALDSRTALQKLEALAAFTRKFAR